MDPAHYTIDPLSLEERQCIRWIPDPKRRGQNRGELQRCGSKVSKSDIDEAQRLQNDSTSVDFRGIILLRVCKNTHRAKLRQNEDCLDFLANQWKSKCADLGLPSQVRFSGAVAGLFKPYPSSRTTKSILSQRIDPKQDARGEVYAFTWPREPDFIKIGYARRTAQERINIWTKCHSQAEELHSIDVEFPERMEALIHAQLSASRHQLVKKCDYCHRWHNEWFKIGPSTAIEVLDSWKAVIAMSPLYVDRTLGKVWLDYIRRLGDPRITAAILLQRDQGSQAQQSQEMSSLGEQFRDKLLVEHPED